MVETVSGIWFVVDTNVYAGNNERALCAWMTGLVGDDNVGHEQAASFHRDCQSLPGDLVGCVPDEHGCARPSSIYPTRECCSVAIRLERMPTPAEQEFLIARARSFDQWRRIKAGEPEKVEILGFRIATETKVRREQAVTSMYGGAQRDPCTRVCKTCYAPCRDGTIEHGRGCYHISQDGGGSEQCDEPGHQ